MEYRTFGKTGLKVSAVGFGCGRVGGLLISGSEADRRLAIRKALDAGINWFDTAETYGSEGALGQLLEEVPEKPHVSTKITVDPKAGDLAGQIESHGEECLKRLRRSFVDVLQVHNRIDDDGSKEYGRALTVEQVLGKGGVAEGLERMKKKGKARFMGFTALGGTRDLIKVIDSGRFDACQVYYNIVNPSAARPMPAGWKGQSLTGIIVAAKRQNMGTLAIRVLDGGIIATDDRKKPVSMMAKETDEPTEVRKTQAALAALGGGLGSRPQIGLRFAISCPDIGVSLVGIGAPEHVDEAVAAVAMGPLPRAALDRLEPLYERDFA
jgi:aryl-alcohol dehydrogenase-like predicted oxidoreductase